MATRLPMTNLCYNRVDALGAKIKILSHGESGRFERLLDGKVSVLRGTCRGDCRYLREKVVPGF
jgi:hypothetical protein